MFNLLDLPVFDPETGLLNTVVETPKGSRSKWTYEKNFGVFRLKKMLPAGASFPFDFGFIPGTHGDDGDPLDVLILKDDASYPGCLIPARLIGVIEAKQTKKGKTLRNDRLLAVADGDALFCNLKSIKDLSTQILSQIEHFFISYNQVEGKQFNIQRRSDVAAARKIVLQGQIGFRAQSPVSTPLVKPIQKTRNVE